MTNATIIATGTEFVNKGLRRTQPVIEEMIKNANKSIHILNYSFGPDAEGLWDMLDDILGKGKHVTIVVNDLSRLDDDNPHEKKVKERLYGLNNKFGKRNFVLADFKKPDGWMHAKVIVADRNKMVIGSANLSKGGLKNHYEMGVLIEGEEAGMVAKIIQQTAINKELCTIVPPSK
jgi:phosphatidylserine/phosphatidylglycerophosphate/cardiolipin synthase-like enzyme